MPYVIWLSSLFLINIASNAVSNPACHELCLLHMLAKVASISMHHFFFVTIIIFYFIIVVSFTSSGFLIV